MACQNYPCDHWTNRSSTIVAIGKTGKGKSSTLNSILQLVISSNCESFVSADGPESISDQVVCKEIMIPEYPTCRLVDTIGLFDTNLTMNDKNNLTDNISCIDEEHRLVLEQFVDVMQLCRDGIDAFLFVLRATDRATAEEEQAIDVIFRYLGWNILDHVIFVITGKDVAKHSTFLAWRDHIGSILEKRGYPRSLIENRFMFMDNVNPTDTQAYELLSLIRYVTDMNGGCPYKPADFQSAQLALEEERKRIKAELEIAFQIEVDAKVRPLRENHEKEMSNLQDQMNILMMEGLKLREDQLHERQQFIAQLEALKKAQDEEKSRLQYEVDMEIRKLQRKKREAYDKERMEMQELIKRLGEDMLKNQKDLEVRLRMANENLACARMYCSNGGSGCAIM